MCTSFLILESPGKVKKVQEILGSGWKVAALSGVDGEDQWTCTPTASSEVPARDELYNRKTDIAQLHNVIDKHPEAAKELLRTLREFMGEIRIS